MCVAVMATEVEVLAAGPGPTPCSGAPSTGMKITDLLKMDLPTKGMEQSKTLRFVCLLCSNASVIALN